MTGSFFVAGWVLAENRWIDGYVQVVDGAVSSIGEGPAPREPLARGMVLPGIVNHHTHVGDAAVPKPPEWLGPAEVFAPPDGYKHHMLRDMPSDHLEDGVVAFMGRLTASGTVEHTDFREGGIKGLELLQRALTRTDHPPRSRIFGRPAALGFDQGEMDCLVQVVDGLGLSAVMDWPWEPLRDVVAAAHAADLPVALHCSESSREELSRVLELEPEFLVHMAFGTEQDFKDLAAAGVPVVACPRSTSRFTRAPPVWEMAKAGVEVRLGTDNAMMQGPSVLDEVSFLLSMPEVTSSIHPQEVLGWALPPAKGSNKGGSIGVSTGSRDLAVLPLGGVDPLSFLANVQGRGADLVMTDGRLWRRLDEDSQDQGVHDA